MAKYRKKPIEIEIHHGCGTRLAMLASIGDDGDVYFDYYESCGWIDKKEAHRFHAWLGRYLAWVEAKGEK